MFDPETYCNTIELADTKDILVWTVSKTGKFMVKSAYNKNREESALSNLDLTSSSYQTLQSLWIKNWFHCLTLRQKSNFIYGAHVKMPELQEKI